MSTRQLSEGVNVLENIIEDVPVQVGTVDLGLLN